MSALTSLIEELKRRNVARVLTAYAVGSFVILQLCDILFPAMGISDEAIGIVLGVLIIGLPITGIFSWMYEITPDGLKRTREVSSEESIAGTTGQRINFIIIVLLSLALGFFAWEYFNHPENKVTGPVAVQEPAATTENMPAEKSLPLARTPVADTRPSIAVLPFVNMSSDEDNVYFSDGLSEEILNLLAQRPELRVAGRTSSFFYKGKNVNLTEIGETLAVDHILEGSVRKSGSKVRITAQLISASDGFHLWSKTFDRKLDDIFAVQDEIAGEVTRAMEVTLLSDGINAFEQVTTNAEAYDLYLRGRNALYDRGEDNVRLSTRLFSQAIALDPEYTPAYLDLAVAELLLNWNYGARNVEESLAAAKAALDKAERLAPLNSEYYAVLGLYHSNAAGVDDAHVPEAEAAFEKAISLNANNVRAYMWWATLVSSAFSDRAEEAMALNAESRRLDPLNRVANGNYAGYLSDVGRFEEAIAFLNRMIQVDPEYNFYRSIRTMLYLSLYDLVNLANSLGAMDKADLRYPFIVYQLFLQFHDTQRLREALDQIPTDNPSIEFVQLAELSDNATPAELKAEAEVLLLKPDPDFYAYPLLSGLLEHGEYDLARRLIENARPGFSSPNPSAAPSNGADPRFLYLTTIHRLGQTSRARDYARKLLEVHENVPYLGMRGKGIADAMCHLVLGNRELAIESLYAAYQAGWAGYYPDIERNPVWADIIKDPRVQALKASIDEKLESQRPAVYASLRQQGLISAL